MRKYFIDNLRWISILLLFPYHTSMIYNNFGENFYVKGEGVSLLSNFIRICSPCFMPLLFAIAGISSYYALNRRTPKQYIEERVWKLFIPLISGILLLVPMQTFYAEKFHNGYNGGYFNKYILFFIKETDLTGYTGGFTPAQLWFILYLFIISLIALPIAIKYNNGRKVPVYKLSLLKILLMFLIIWLMSFILNIGGKSIGEYFALFIIGYIMLSQDIIQEKLDENRWYLFIAFILITILNLLFENLWYHSFKIAYSIFRRFLSWIGILAIMGMGKHYLDFHNKITNYFIKAAFPIYVFHQSWLILVAYYTLNTISFIPLQVIVIMVGSFILTIITYEVFRRISFTRLLFGIKK
ncbi:acyltransferase family protein [Clostridium sporogenes]|uniref:acyltransferase family protein n=1 Tax=Clostridium sporogenes TaxID=1509 RepID=UPI00024BA72D|nr:acyltransferase family protein [Clostridium sporogenes]EHN15062.1 putative membrane protein [Clostridium sporogenes PA 3679]MCW6105147.1 acyltransferase family protein [Clostridium sporogenes]MDU4598005.1 acyltransferase family protein [Clostridium sporogenes]NFQ35437.1 acyltransferase [Clostridium sporogenes]NFQ58769.1 acyltransferase [Clostridium sporogenes]